MRLFINTALMLFLALAPLTVKAQPAEPEQLVRDVTNQVLQTLRDNQGRLQQEPGYVFRVVDELVLPHFDFEAMSKLVLAKYWRRATPEQRQRFVQEFRQLLVRTYAKSLAEYRDQEVVFLPTRGRPGADDVVVRSEIEQGSGIPIPVDYRLRREADSWKVFDVAIDDVSLVTNYRASFAQEIGRQGIDGLIDQLARRNAEQD